MSNLQTIKITNHYFKDIYTQFEVKSIKDLPDESLAYACSEIYPKVAPEFNIEIKNNRPYKGKLNRFNTIKKMEDNSTYKFLLPSQDWDFEINEMMAADEYQDKLAKLQVWTEMYDYLAYYKLAVVIKPDETKELIIPNAFLVQFMKTPEVVNGFVSVTDMEGKAIEPTITPQALKLMYDNTDEMEELRTMTKTELLKRARKYQPNLMQSTPPSKLISIIALAEKL